MTFDLNILPLFRQDGQDRPELPGVHVAMPPRRATRVRSQDRLIIFMHFEGKGVVLRDQLNQLLKSIEKSYYSRTGTITSTLQAITEEINDILLNQNLKYGSSGQQAHAYLTLAVMRRDMLYIAQSGLMHGFLISGEKVDHFYDANIAGRGLGLSRTASVQFSQAPLAKGTLLIYLPNLPQGWNKGTLENVHGQQLGVLRRRFLSDAGSDLKALIIETIPGEGDLYLLSAEAKSARHTAETHPPEEILEDSSEPTPETIEVNIESSQPTVAFSEETVPIPVAESQGKPKERFVSNEDQELVSKPAREIPDIGPILKNAIKKTGGWFGTALRSARTFFLRMLPDEEEFKISSSMMAFIAVIIPVVVVAATALIYARIGLNRQYARYYQQANQAMIVAKSEGDQSSLHLTLNTALADITRAEEYQVTDESQALREEIQTFLDTFDYVNRLDFQPAIAGNLSSSIKIKRMEATGRDLYMLDSNSGSVMRAWLTGTGYEMDPTFSCGPGQYGPYIVSEIIDIATLPRDSEKQASIIGLDGNGNLIYCEPDEAPYVVPLAPPHSNWGQPTAITIEDGNLYILDPITNAVWIYFGNKDQFIGSANFFFTEEVPNLQSAIDMTVSQDDLLILHADGHTTLCTYSILEEAPTECEDPALLKDERPGRENAATLPDARFFQLSRTQPPEPSIYFLDPITRSVYQFSLKLSLIQQLRSETDLPAGVVTAYAISPTRSIFIALDNQVLIAFLP
ncbi:MAG: hypothetical protein HON98_04895 [Chloroflexi bacterium]|mgnify:FL=1|nr:hypothetical protein [Chloroflexota bacterium]MBT3671123.1 hypothetical protein [Chloroflexota bacterium]MBT4004394.1 hypothetical protein [Chloroflexota bacterium]MBT4304418.1 hypothetical protein [Chloroflexota bacterium]MBT4534437.1 hypothetical protein [Chloroflexota bacterium]